MKKWAYIAAASAKIAVVTLGALVVSSIPTVATSHSDKGIQDGRLCCNEPPDCFPCNS